MLEVSSDRKVLISVGNLTLVTCTLELSTIPCLGNLKLIFYIKTGKYLTFSMTENILPGTNPSGQPCLLEILACDWPQSRECSGQSFPPHWVPWQPSHRTISKQNTGLTFIQSAALAGKNLLAFDLIQSLYSSELSDLLEKWKDCLHRVDILL